MMAGLPIAVAVTDLESVPSTSAQQAAMIITSAVKLEHALSLTLMWYCQDPVFAGIAYMGKILIHIG